MIGQNSEEGFNTSSESAGTDEPVYNSEGESNPPEVEVNLYETQKFETEADEDYTDPELTLEPMAEDVPMWKPESAVSIMDDSEDNKVPAVGEGKPESFIRPNAEAQITLLKTEDSERFQMRWNEVQGNFVDDPRAAVQQADELVSEVVELITQMFAAERNILEGQWKQGNDVSTEDLRKALQHYRSFFKRLVV
jgi:hypothetical protein